MRGARCENSNSLPQPLQREGSSEAHKTYLVSRISYLVPTTGGYVWSKVKLRHFWGKSRLLLV